MNLKNLLIVAIALLLVALGNWLTEEGVKQVDKRLAPEAAEASQDYYLQDFTISALNEAGELDHKLQASMLNYFEAAGETKLLKPELQVYKQKKLQWRVVSESGELKQPLGEVILQGKVRMVQSDTKNPIKLTTSRLTIFPEQGRAETRQAVTLLQDDSRTVSSAAAQILKERHEASQPVPVQPTPSPVRARSEPHPTPVPAQPQKPASVV